MSHIHRWARLADHAPWLANLGAGNPLSKWIAGVDQQRHMPRFARSFRKQFGSRRTSGERVMLWPDTFNNHFRPGTAMAAARLLEAAGYQVSIPQRQLCCGRPLYDWGYLDEAKALWEETFDTLRDAIASGIPIIGLEPACTSAFKDELVSLFPDREEAARLSTQVVHITDFVGANFERFGRPKMGGAAILQAHCHHHAVVGFNSELDLLDRLGIEVSRPPQGCCGMAGAFGFAKETADLSRRIGEREILPAVRAVAEDTLILADGFSCREQLEQGTGRATMHIAELLFERIQAR
jgi:Fe-S oxidoreductase